MNGKRGLSLAVAVAALASLSFADTVYLASGESLSGTVIHLGTESLVIAVPSRGHLIFPWGEVERVEFQPASGGPAFPLDEVAWNNALVEACRRLEAMDPLKTLVVNLGLTWVAFALGNYLEDHCGRPACWSVSCTFLTLGVAKTVWDLLTYPKRQAALRAEVARLWEIGRVNGYVFRGCYITESALLVQLR
ncbi:TPA: hypothetical protein EYP84_02005 [Candidatus Bipolaricaulota bacterium]|nr:hypothetical protein [Candidatus Bipolaricaulota bacterium]